MSSVCGKIKFIDKSLKLNIINSAGFRVTALLLRLPNEDVAVGTRMFNSPMKPCLLDHMVGDAAYMTGGSEPTQTGNEFNLGGDKGPAVRAHAGGGLFR